MKRKFLLRSGPTPSTAFNEAEREGEARALLRERFGAGKAKGLKALLASAPLRGINLSRDPDFGRQGHRVRDH